MESPGRMLQENLLVLLVWSPTAAPIIRNSMDYKLFEGHYREVARRAYDYLDEYKKPPSDHIADLFAPELEGKDQLKAREWELLLHQLYDSKDSVDEDFTLGRLHTFIRLQTIRDTVLLTADKLRSGGENVLDEIENLWSKANKNLLKSFDPGLQLSDKAGVLRSLEKRDEPAFHTGIKALDDRGLGPGRKELHLLIAAAKHGKSWWLMHLGKAAWAANRAHVLHITLEISQEQTVTRYLQSIFGIAKREGTYVRSKFTEDGKIDRETLKNVLTFKDEEFDQKLSGKLDGFKNRLKRIIVKEFPTGSLTINGLKAYLDSLEAQMNWVPDLLLLDYADLMFTGGRDEYRINLGNLYKELRGLAVERNIAIATASQTNREGAGVKLVRETHVGEDWSKIPTADTVLTYSRTIEERKLGLARLTVTNSRKEEDGIIILITQNYALGQFAQSSRVMSIGPDYWNMVSQVEKEEQKEESEREGHGEGSENEEQEEESLKED